MSRLTSIINNLSREKETKYLSDEAGPEGLALHLRQNPYNTNRFSRTKFAIYSFIIGGTLICVVGGICWVANKAYTEYKPAAIQAPEAVKTTYEKQP